MKEQLEDIIKGEIRLLANEVYWQNIHLGFIEQLYGTIQDDRSAIIAKAENAHEHLTSLILAVKRMSGTIPVKTVLLENEANEITNRLLSCSQAEIADISECIIKYCFQK